MSCTLVFGGARSGKSALAEQLAQRAAETGAQVIYVATAAAGDSEMQSRIVHHQQRRPAHWQTLEEPLALGALIQKHSRPDTVMLIDCLTVWLSNLLFSEQCDFPDVGQIEPPSTFVQQRQQLLCALEQAAGEVILVSNEVGMGIVPAGAVSRWFVDEAGRLNQAVAARCDQVIWVAAGLPLYMKGRAC